MYLYVIRPDLVHRMYVAGYNPPAFALLACTQDSGIENWSWSIPAPGTPEAEQGMQKVLWPSNPSANPTRWIRWHDIQAGFKSLLPADTVVVGHAFAVSGRQDLGAD
jgi:hypothetical protein